MITALIQYSLTEEVYRNLLFLCTKKGYKVKLIDKDKGIIKAERKSVLGAKKFLELNISANEKDIVRIIIQVTKNNKSLTGEEEKIRDTLFKYF